MCCCCMRVAIVYSGAAIAEMARGWCWPRLTAQVSILQCVTHVTMNRSSIAWLYCASSLSKVRYSKDRYYKLSLRPFCYTCQVFKVGSIHIYMQIGLEWCNTIWVLKIYLCSLSTLIVSEGFHDLNSNLVGLLWNWLAIQVRVLRDQGSYKLVWVHPSYSIIATETLVVHITHSHQVVTFRNPYPTSSGPQRVMLHTVKLLWSNVCRKRVSQGGAKPLIYHLMCEMHLACQRGAPYMRRWVAYGCFALPQTCTEG